LKKYPIASLGFDWRERQTDEEKKQLDMIDS
jgi:hypothetical protein